MKGIVKWFDDKKGFGFIVNELGEDVPVGVYFYRLEAGKYNQMRKMIRCR